MSRAERDAGALVALYEKEPRHVAQVAALADQLFASLTRWHRHGERERLLLRLAALLHDIGKARAIGGRGHHLESARMIREHRWTDLTPEEIAVVAQIARYHRKELPAPDHAEFIALPVAARAKVEKLGGLLRLADALDRSHEARVARVIGLWELQGLRIRVEADSWKEERAAAERKKDLLERVAGSVVIE